MRIVADLHVHSHFSRATSRDLDPIALHRVALQKGIGLVGTGDFTHPGWMLELEEALEPAEEGLFRLRPDARRAAEQGLPPACHAEVRFVLQVEISNIYKKDGRTRKNHNLVFVPSMDAARALGTKLGRIGNLSSDGRPILGLDARDLLEITLESDPLAFLVPAHIWTPWFSMLGFKSGFDSVGACFGDLAGHVFAVETGLSSDPPMNWRVSELDRLSLISNSDAHSPAKLGREANLLDIDLCFGGLRRALETRDGLLGTLEFFPEEGKYHLDGHRKCDVRLEPEQTRELGGRCPVCGEKLTVGVLSRVVELADHPGGRRPEGARGYESLVPLAEVAAEVCGTGVQSRRVRVLVERLLEKLGPELAILRHAPLEDIGKAGGRPLAEAIRRVRQGELSIAAGYDGEFGQVRIFAPGERDQFAGQMVFVDAELSVLGTPRPRRRSAPDPAGGATRGSRRTATEVCVAEPARADEPDAPSASDPLAGLDAEQRRAATTCDAPVLVVAGPGAGKTRTLVARIAHLVASGRATPKQLLAITFTNQAADELRQRIAATVPDAKPSAPLVCTFHGFGLGLLREDGDGACEIADDEQRMELSRAALGPGSRQRDAARLLQRISLAKQSPEPAAVLGDEPAQRVAFERYQELLGARRLWDVDDLVLRAYGLLAGRRALARRVAQRYPFVSVDEYQDVNDVQAALVQLIAGDGRGLCAIGDPDQAIYGFRGARPGHFARFSATYPGTQVVRISTSYRLTQSVLRVAQAVLGAPRPLLARANGPLVEVVACPTAKSEAEQIVVRLERLLGGTSLFAVDSGRGGEDEELQVGFGEVAVLTRTKVQHPVILEAFARSGIPCQVVGEDEPHDPRSQSVALMTCHASKGREYEVVFVAGVEPRLLPLEVEGLGCDPDEERRLLYVAMTRAKRLVVLSHAARRTLFGQALPGGPSPLLQRVPEHLLVRSAPSLPPARPRDRQLSLFD